MRQNVTVKGVDRVLRKLRAHPQLVSREVESVLKQEARALCVEYGSWTMAGPGFEEGRQEAFRKRVDGEVRRVFATRDKPGKVFAMIRQRDPLLAAAYWHAYKSKKPRAMQAIVRKANLPQGVSPADHKRARTGKKGRVGKLEAPLSLATEAQVAAFSRKQQTLVTFAKAGWYCAARALGGRVRRNIREAGVKRRTEEIFPPATRKLARRFPSAGGAIFRGAGMGLRVEIFTRVKHAREALSESHYQMATARAREKLAAALKHSLAALHRKSFGTGRKAA